jgi:hypothetical protein
MITAIKKWVQDRRLVSEQRQYERLHEEAIRLNEKFNRACQGVQKAVTGMISRPCPMNNGFCSTRCVHFDYGNVFIILYMTGLDVYRTMPKCKLWAKK